MRTGEAGRVGWAGRSGWATFGEGCGDLRGSDEDAAQPVLSRYDSAVSGEAGCDGDGIGDCQQDRQPECGAGGCGDRGGKDGADGDLDLYLRERGHGMDGGERGRGDDCEAGAGDCGGVVAGGDRREDAGSGTGAGAK